MNGDFTLTELLKPVMIGDFTLTELLKPVMVGDFTLRVVEASHDW
jgi:hypothetical protein